MTVAPIPDLVLDVMAAADPASQRVAATRLERLSAANGEFAATMTEKIGAGAPEQGVAVGQGDSASPAGAVIGRDHVRIVRMENSDRAVFRRFEAFVLQTFVESMLPQGGSEVFGKGTAGMVWRSMLAEQIGNEMAKGDGIGIARQLAKTRHAGDAAGKDG
jgi:hypothetical protein